MPYRRNHSHTTHSPTPIPPQGRAESSSDTKRRTMRPSETSPAAAIPTWRSTLKMRWYGSFSCNFDFTMSSTAKTTPSLPRRAMTVLFVHTFGGNRQARYRCRADGAPIEQCTRTASMSVAASAEKIIMGFIVWLWDPLGPSWFCRQKGNMPCCILLVLRARHRGQNRHRPAGGGQTCVAQV